MPGPAAPAARRGRRGRRTQRMIRVARERVANLFALAELESRRGANDLPDRYVRLARRVGTRYNVRIPPEYRDSYCRGCSTYWVEGRTVSTRLRGGTRTRMCLLCGRRRRVRYGAPLVGRGPPEPLGSRGAPQPGAVLADAPTGSSESEDAESEEDP